MSRSDCPVLRDSTAAADDYKIGSGNEHVDGGDDCGGGGGCSSYGDVNEKVVICLVIM